MQTLLSEERIQEIFDDDPENAGPSGHRSDPENPASESGNSVGRESRDKSTSPPPKTRRDHTSPANRGVDGTLSDLPRTISGTVSGSHLALARASQTISWKNEIAKLIQERGALIKLLPSPTN